MDLFERVPEWILRPLPVNAVSSDTLNKRVDALAQKLPESLDSLDRELQRVQSYLEYDDAANRACAHVWLAREQFYSADPALPMSLLTFTLHHMVEQAQARIFRRLAKHPLMKVRRRTRECANKVGIREVALPREADGNWNHEGWLHGAVDVPFNRHRQGRRVQERNGLPVITKLADLRKLLDIRSPRQLGWFLLSSDRENGPYTTFTIPKRDGQPRVICAPKPQLRWLQRQILDRILAKIPAHDAAHGFLEGRSIVTNAEHHVGAELVVKFDLQDFFPTIHYFRVLGLFARLGYTVDNARFGTEDSSRQVAPTLARLCCYTPDPTEWGKAALPQGAPTSPAISNLVCRRLDARLSGLATRNNGVYTRYADDLTFSFRKAKGVNLGRFRWWVDQVCHQEGFLINQKKFHVIRDSQRQLVTGIVVNEELRVPREERRRFRAILHNCRTKGIESQARDHPSFTEYLRGFASYVHMVHPEEGAELLQQVEELLKSTGP